MCATSLKATEVEHKEDPVIKRGLTYSTDSSDMLKHAIGYTNLMLDRINYKLVNIQNMDQQPNVAVLDSAIPIYSIKQISGIQSTPAAVPWGCRCVFVDTSYFQSWITKHTSGEARLNLQPSYLLAYLLLHEIGHIEYKHASAGFSNGVIFQLNIEPSLAKVREEDADEFAAILIRDLLNNKQSPAWLTATWISLQLTKMSWNMQAYRTLNEFGASTTGKPSVYFDQSYSHPNLALRILKTNYFIHKTEEAKSLLETFEASREISTNIEPLYQENK